MIFEVRSKNNGTYLKFLNLTKLLYLFVCLPFFENLLKRSCSQIKHYIKSSVLRLHFINFKPYSKEVENEGAVFIRSMLNTNKLLDTCFKYFQTNR